MTKEITPTIDQARNRYARGRLGWYPTAEDLEDGGGWLDKEFNRFVRSVQAKAFDEGFDQGHYVNDSEDRDCGCKENPYL